MPLLDLFNLCYNSTMIIRDIPGDYTVDAPRPGRITKIEYDNGREKKYALVYLPYSYDEKEKYDILYLIHGGGGRQEDYFGDMEYSTRFKKAIDQLMEKKELRPIIIVSATVYGKDHDRDSRMDSWRAVKEFIGEVDGFLMPAVEGTFSTYAPTIDREGFIASRMHRSFGGFSMGFVTTWYMFLEKLQYFSTFIPMSGDCWVIERRGGRTRPKETVAALYEAARKRGYTKDDFRICAVTGSEDKAREGLINMLDAMKEYEDAFDMSETGNTALFIKEGGVHEMKYVKQYLFNVLPVLFPDK